MTADQSKSGAIFFRVRTALAAKRKQLLVVVLLFLILSAQFCFNMIGSASQSDFHNYENWTQSWLLGRLVLTRKEGLFSYGALQPMAGADNGRAAYFDDLSLQYTKFYLSQNGGQAFLLGVLDQVMPLSTRMRYRLYRAGFGLLFSAVCTLILVWLYRVGGLTSAFFALITLLLAYWPAIYARQLFLCSWAFYIPFIFGLLLVRSRASVTPVSLRIAFPVICLGMFIKCFLNGFEFISTVSLMALCPFVYELFVKQIGCKQGLRRIAAISAAVFLAVVLSMSLLFVQIAVKDGGGFSAAYEHVRFKIMHRTYNIDHTLLEKDFPELNHGPIEVVARYTNSKWIDLDALGRRWLGTNPLPFSKIPFSVPLLMLLIAIGALLHPKMRSDRSYLALVAMAVFSVLAPLSWFIVFKNHSWRHPHMVPIVWHMPFVFLASAAFGMFCSRITHHLRSTHSAESC